MQIVGNGSSSDLLRWYQDHSRNDLPRAWILSVPMFVYRLAMLAWSLWISFTLLKVLKWGWEAFSAHGIWLSPPKAKSKTKAAAEAGGETLNEKAGEKKTTSRETQKKDER